MAGLQGDFAVPAHSAARERLRRVLEPMRDKGLAH
jgi:hypothetical protein